MKTRAKSDLAKKVVAKVAKDQKVRRRKAGMSTEMMQTLGAVAFMGVCLAIVGATMFPGASDKPVRSAQRDAAKKVTVAAADDIDERDTVRPRAKTEGLAAFVQSGLDDERKAERQRRGETELASTSRGAPANDDDDDVPVVRPRGTPMVFDVPRKLERSPVAEPAQPKPAPAERVNAEVPAPAPTAKPAAVAAASAERPAPAAAVKPTLPAAPVDDEAPAPAATTVEPPRGKPAVAEITPAVTEVKTAVAESKPTAAPVKEAVAQPLAKEPVKAAPPVVASAPAVAAVEPVRQPRGFPPAPSPRLAEPRVELPDEPKPAVAEAPAAAKVAVVPGPAAPAASAGSDKTAHFAPAAAAPVKPAASSPAIAAIAPGPVEDVAAKSAAAPVPPAAPTPVVASLAPVTVAPVAPARIEPAAQTAAVKPGAAPAPVARVDAAPAVTVKAIEVAAVTAKPSEPLEAIAKVAPVPAVPAIVAAAKPVHATAAPIVPAKPVEAQPVAAKAVPVIAAQPAPVSAVAAKPAEPVAPLAKTSPAPAATQPVPVVVAAVPPAVVAAAAPATAPVASAQPEVAPAPKSRWEEWSRDILAMFAPAKPAFKGAGDLKDCADCPDLMVVPTGFFTMGADAGDRDARPQERPAVRARITKSFAMGRAEVTVAEYRAFLAATKRAAPDCASFATAAATSPVTCVSHADAIAYVDWLSGQTGERYRLPSAAEWEYAAKAGRESTSIPVRVAALKGTATDATAQANPFGFVGMGGSVAELVADCFTKSLAEAPTDGTAAVAEGGCRNRIVKDGGDAEPAPYHRPSSRRAVAFDHRIDGIGFRVAREISTKKR